MPFIPRAAVRPRVAMVMQFWNLVEAMHCVLLLLIEVDVLGTFGALCVKMMMHIY